MTYRIVVDALVSGDVMIGVTDEDVAFSFSMSAQDAERLAYTLLDRARRAGEDPAAYMDELGSADGLGPGDGSNPS